MLTQNGAFLFKGYQQGNRAAALAATTRNETFLYAFDAGKAASLSSASGGGVLVVCYGGDKKRHTEAGGRRRGLAASKVSDEETERLVRAARRAQPFLRRPPRCLQETLAPVLSRGLGVSHMAFCVAEVPGRNALARTIAALVLDRRLTAEQARALRTSPFPCLRGSIHIERRVAEERRALLLMEQSSASGPGSAAAPTLLLAEGSRHAQRDRLRSSSSASALLLLQSGGGQGPSSSTGSGSHHHRDGSTQGADLTSSLQKKTLHGPGDSNIGASTDRTGAAGGGGLYHRHHSNRDWLQAVYENLPGPPPRWKCSALFRLGGDRDFGFLQPASPSTFQYVDNNRVCLDHHHHHAQRVRPSPSSDPSVVFWSEHEIRFFLLRYFVTPKDFRRIAAAITATNPVAALTHDLKGISSPIAPLDCRAKTKLHCADFYYRFKYFFELKRFLACLRLPRLRNQSTSSSSNATASATTSNRRQSHWTKDSVVSHVSVCACTT